MIELMLKAKTKLVILTELLALRRTVNDSELHIHARLHPGRTVDFRRKRSMLRDREKSCIVAGTSSGTRV
jgi:hypothetical protein